MCVCVCVGGGGEGGGGGVGADCFKMIHFIFSLSLKSEKANDGWRFR